jgi:hypothetical protein
MKGGLWVLAWLAERSREAAERQVEDVAERIGTAQDNPDRADREGVPIETWRALPNSPTAG